MFTEVISYFHKGGLFMYPLFLCSCAMFIVAIERFLYYKNADCSKHFANDYCNALHTDRWQDAVKLCKDNKGRLPLLLLAGMERLKKYPKNLEGFLDAEGNNYIAQLRQRLNYLSVIVTMAPLLGLLGTILGMISSFSIFNLRSGQPLAITSGIGEALIATATGLCIAVLSLICHAYFTARLDRIITDLEHCLSTLCDAAARGINQ